MGSRLLGYASGVQFKPKKENRAVDVLSRVHCNAVSIVMNDELVENMEEIEADPTLVVIIQDLERDSHSHP